MKSCIVIIQNSEGLHARPATFFIQKANSFKSSLWVAKDPAHLSLVKDGVVDEAAVKAAVAVIDREGNDGVRKVNAKSLLGVLSLGIAKGDVITLTADGEDEDEALEGLATLIDGGLKF